MSTKSLAALAIAIRFDGDGSPHLSVPLWEKGTVVGSTTLEALRLRIVPQIKLRGEKPF